MVNNKTITYKEYNRRLNKLEHIQALGVELLYNKSLFKIGVGGIMIVIGVITLPFPTGSILLIGLGLSLMAHGGVNRYWYRDMITRKIRLQLWRFWLW